MNGVVAAVISSALGGSAAALTRYAIHASDPVTLATVATTRVAVAVTASLLPGYRAAKVDPLKVLRTN